MNYDMPYDRDPGRGDTADQGGPGRTDRKRITAADRRNRMANYSNGRSGRDVEFSIVEKIGIIENYKSGWSKEANLVAWNGNPPKLDIRDWDPNHERMSRGITLHEKEAEKLAQLLAGRFLAGAGRYNNVSRGEGEQFCREEAQSSDEWRDTSSQDEAMVEPLS